MRIPTVERETRAALLNSDIELVLSFGKKWLLDFEARKTKAIAISKKKDRQSVPLFLNGMEWRSQRRRHWMY